MKENHIIVDSVDERMISFIKKHHTLTLATSCNNVPWCCSCFYVYDKKENKFIITSDFETRHVSEFIKQQRVAGAIALETLVIGRIQGIQFSGLINEVKENEIEHYRKIYIKRFPVAAFSELKLWSIEPDLIKFTHNLFGIGKKLIWERKKV